MFNDCFVDMEKTVAELIVVNNDNHLDYMTHINQPNSFFLDQFIVMPLKN